MNRIYFYLVLVSLLSSCAEYSERMRQERYSHKIHCDSDFPNTKICGERRRPF